MNSFLKTIYYEKIFSFCAKAHESLRFTGFYDITDPALSQNMQTNSLNTACAILLKWVVKSC